MEKTTECIKCGITIPYKTKKPKWCKECNPFKDALIYGNKNIPTRSSLEYSIGTWLDSITDMFYITNGYYSWIKSPKGYPLQLDFLVYKEGFQSFAIEVDGLQHSQQQYFQSKEEFEYLKECDRIKEKCLRDVGIKLVKITKCENEEQLKVILKSNNIKYV